MNVGVVTSDKVTPRRLRMLAKGHLAKLVMGLTGRLNAVVKHRALLGW